MVHTVRRDVTLARELFLEWERQGKTPSLSDHYLPELKADRFGV
jgi:hypothetical protein